MAKGRRRRIKTAKPRAAAAPKRAKGGRKPAAPTMTSALASLTEARNHLVTQRDALDGQIAVIERALADLGGAAPRARISVRAAKRPTGRGRRGGRRPGALKDRIAAVLATRKGPMAVKDITAAVMKTGYKTQNKTLAKSVGIALTQMPEVAKVRRGTFKLK